MSNEATLEAQIHRSIPDMGYRADMTLPLSLWKQTAGLVLTAGTTPAIVAQANATVPPKVIKFAGGSASSVIATFDGVIPGEFLPTPATENSVALDYDLQLIVPIRKVEATDIAGDSALKFDLVFSWGRAAQAGIVLTAIGVALPAFVSDNTSDTTGIIGMANITFDIGAEIRSEIAAGTITATPPVIRPGDWFKMAVGPHSTTDAGDFQEMLSPILRWRRCAALYYSGSGTAGVNLGSTFRSIRGGGGG